MRGIQHKPMSLACRTLSCQSIKPLNPSTLHHRIPCLRSSINQLHHQHYHTIHSPISLSNINSLKHTHLSLNSILLSRSWRLRPKGASFDWKEYQPLRRLPSNDDYQSNNGSSNQSNNQNDNQSDNQSNNPDEEPRYEPNKAVFMTVSAFVLANLAVFLAWQTAAVTSSSHYQSFDERIRAIMQQKQQWKWMMDNFTVSEKNLAEGRYHCLLTSAFSQMSFPHLLFNCVAIGSFGLHLGHVIGPRSFATLYIVSAVAASAAHVMYTRYQRQHSHWRGRYNTDSPALGASGAAMAIAVCYAMLFPYDKFLVMFVLPVPAWLCVSLAVGFDMYGALKDDPRNPIGHSAHLGGAAVGFLYYLFCIRNRRYGAAGHTLQQWKDQLRPKF